MAKKQREFVAFGQMSKKAKVLHFLKIFGISFASVLGLVAGVVLYVFATGGFNPPYVPLTEWSFSQSEYVIDTNNQISLDDEGNQLKDNNTGDLMFEQITDKDGNPIYNYVMIVPNEGCTELDAVVQLKDWTDIEPSIQLVEDENVQALDKNANDPAGTIYYKYSVKINSPIYIKTRTITEGGNQRLLSGWVRLQATQEMMPTTSTWVFVDTATEKLDISLKNSSNFETEQMSIGGSNQTVFDVYPNSSIKIENLVSPAQSLALPSSSRSGTEFTGKKTVVYQTSDPDIATISSNGTINIVPNKEGQVFSVSAYIISKYNDLDKMPNITDFEDDDIISYKKATNRICVLSNVIYFKINEISVSEITTLKDGANRVSYNYNVFESGQIKFDNNSTKTVSKNNYFVDLVLTDSADDSYKQELLTKINLFVAMESDMLTQTEIDNINSGMYVVSNLTDLIINNHHIVDASQYISIDLKTGNYVINQYSQNTFYMILYYGDVGNDMLFDYIPFTISKVAVSSVSTKNQAINLDYVEDGGENISSTYALTANNFATINPNSATYGYDNLFYFVCDSESGEKIVSVNSTVSMSINSKKYYLVSYTNNNKIDLGTLKPLSNGRATLYAVVLRTLPEAEVYDSVTGQLISPTNYTELEINGGTIKLLRNASDELDFEYYSSPVTLTISKDAVFSGIQEYTSIQENVYNKSDKVNVVVSQSDPTYENYNTDSTLYAEISQGGELAVQVNYSGDLVDLEGGKLEVVHIQGADTTVASVSKLNNTVVGHYYFSILANKVGTTQFQIVYHGSKNDVSVATIGIKVLSIELVEMAMNKTAETIGLEFEVDGETNMATGYDWDYLEFNLGFLSTETEATGFELRTYLVPSDFDTSKIALYKDKEFTEVISGVDEKYNTIQKLVSALTITDDYIDINNNYAVVENNSAKQKSTIYVTANGTKYAFSYQFVSAGTVLLFASSTSTTICSNPVLLTIEIPEITVQYGDGGVGENFGTVYAYGNISDGGLISLDNKTTRSKSVNLYLDGADKIRFFADGGINVSDLIKFKFVQQTVDPLNNSLFKSIKTGATINGSTLTVYETSRAFEDNNAEFIVAYTDFGYTNAEFFKYNIIPDYKVYGSSNKVYLTPTYVDLFNNENLFVTDCQFDGTEKSTNKLYLPVDYVDSIMVLGSKIDNNFLDLFKYADEGSTLSYYHIYCNLSYVTNSIEASSEDYYFTIDSGMQLLKLSYKDEETQIAVRLTAPALKQLSIRITVAPGIDKSFSGDNIVRATQLTSQTPINLSEKLGFIQLTDYEKTNDTEIVANKNYYIYDTNEKDYIIVSNPDGQFLNLYYEQVDLFDVSIDRIDIDVSKITDENLTFYERSDNNVKSTVIESFTPYETFDYQTSTFYNKTTDETIVFGKTYYMINSNNQYEVVSNPTIEDISNYYEIANYYFIKTDDVSSITAGKTYYTKINDHIFEVVNNPDPSEVESYYEKVYSNEVYYGIVEAYYLPIKSDEIAEKYFTKYYEQVEKYKKATGTYDAGETYYTLNILDNTYSEVSNPDAEQLSNYYVKYYDYSPATSFDRNKIYYYKYNYAVISNGSDISQAYQKFSLRITKENDVFKIYADDQIKDLETSINLSLKLTVTITNKDDGAQYSYTGFVYNFKIEGVE